jgi:hypothetical protein
MMENFEGLFASVHQPMKHSYIFLKFWSHEKIYILWFFWIQTSSTWGNMSSSFKMHEWIQLGPLLKLVKTLHPLGNIHTYISLFTPLLVHSWFWWLTKWLKDTQLLHCCHLAFHKCFQMKDLWISWFCIPRYAFWVLNIVFKLFL